MAVTYFDDLGFETYVYVGRSPYKRIDSRGDPPYTAYLLDNFHLQNIVMGGY